MSILKMPIGTDSFTYVRENNCYYIDKTGLIKQIIDKNATVTIITRPRRFGKSLNRSMLDCFFDIRKNSSGIFKGLKITEDKELCEGWMNQYPTILISFKDVGGECFEEACNALKADISVLFLEHRYLLDNPDLNEIQKSRYNEICEGSFNKTALKESLSLLTQMMFEYYKKPVIVLIDEYDVPMAKGNTNGYYREITDVMRYTLSRALKGNSYLKMAVLTGCLRIAKESIFTGLNNLFVDTISDVKFDESFGFTESEVCKLLEDTNLTEYHSLFKSWYDGYRFGRIDVYCPWDVINYASALQDDVNAIPQNYWANTSGNEIIKEYLEGDFDISEDFETLLRGETIEKMISTNVTYDELTKSESNFWSVLYMTGYLTVVPDERPLSIADRNNPMIKQRATRLKIPNQEIMDLFADTVAVWFNESVLVDDRVDLLKAVWSGDGDKLTKIISDYLYNTISYFDYNENYYHAFLAGLLSGIKGYIVSSNVESGLGRADIILKDKRNKQIAIFELKRAKNNEEMSNLCDTALQQIEGNQYAQPFDNGETILKFGIAFFKKKCLVKVCG